MVELAGKNTMVVGLGQSGLAVVRFLVARGARVRVSDQSDAEALGPAASEAEGLGAELVLGGHPQSAFEGLEVTHHSETGGEHRRPDHRDRVVAGVAEDLL